MQAHPAAGVSSATTETDSDMLASAQARSQLFWLLADGLLNGPRAESLALAKEQAQRGDPASPLDLAWQNLIDAVKALDAVARERLAVEHTRLFAGLSEAGVPPPYESAWRPGRDAGAVALAVTQAYAGAGFADIDLDAGPQDHLGVELKFMALLALREAEAWREDDPVAARRRVGQQRAFLDGHLLEWVPRWTDGVAQQTDEPFFLALAALLWAGLVRATEDLNQPIPM